MTDDEFRQQLPILARKGLDNQLPNEYVAYHVDIMQKLRSLRLLDAAFTLLLQLKPNQRIQYVTLEELEYREIFLEIGLIKPTKKGGRDRYIVPKTAVYCGVEEPR